jgi:hypothetical protein
MGGYVTLPATWTADEAAPWIEKSLAAAAVLPPKKPPAKKAAKRG